MTDPIADAHSKEILEGLIFPDKDSTREDWQQFYRRWKEIPRPEAKYKVEFGDGQGARPHHVRLEHCHHCGRTHESKGISFSPADPETMDQESMLFQLMVFGDRHGGTNPHSMCRCWVVDERDDVRGDEKEPTEWRCQRCDRRESLCECGQIEYGPCRLATDEEREEAHRIHDEWIERVKREARGQ